MSEWDTWTEDDDAVDFIYSLRRPITGHSLSMPRNCLSGLRL